jgi:hypothetical protein
MKMKLTQISPLFLAQKLVRDLTSHVEVLLLWLTKLLYRSVRGMTLNLILFWESAVNM